MIVRDRFYFFCLVFIEKDILMICRVFKMCCEVSFLDVFFKILFVLIYCVCGICFFVFKLFYFMCLLELLNFYLFLLFMI